MTEKAFRSKTMRASTKEGMLGSTMVGSAESYLSTYGAFLNAGPLSMGALAALPLVLGSLFQSVSVWLMSNRVQSRKRLLAAATLVQGLVWVPIAMLPFVLGRGQASVLALIALVAIYQISTGIIQPAWNSLMGDVVPGRIRAKFLAHRSRCCSIATFVALLTAGQVIDFFESHSESHIGFGVVFGVAMIARLLSLRCLMSHADPAPRAAASDAQPIDRNFKRFVIFFGLLSLAMQISSPYYSLYLLEELHYSYFDVTLMNGAHMISQFAFMNWWGRRIERQGSGAAMKLSSFGLMLYPLTWLLSGELGAMLLSEIYGGCVLAGFTLSCSAFLFEAVPPEARAKCVAVQAASRAVFMLGGSLIGGLFLSTADSMPQLFGLSSFTSLFLLSFLTRFAVVAVFLRGTAAVEAADA